MKTIITLLFIVSTFSLVAQDEMTNQSVIDLHEMGFETDILKSKINSSSRFNFDTSLEQLQLLKAKGVPSEVIALMIDKSVSIIEGGIFFIKEDTTLLRIEPSAFSGTKTRALGTRLSYGLVPAKTFAYVGGLVSSNIVYGNHFIFQFEKSSSELSARGNWWFKAASSPNEFVLTRLTQKINKKQRELAVGKLGGIASSYQFGINTEDCIPFDFEDLGNGKFKVITSEKLSKGEYCFFYQGTLPTGTSNNQSIFDFSVQ